MSADNYTIREARSDEQSVIVSFILQHFVPRGDIPSRYFRQYEHKIDETEKKILLEDLKNRYSAIVTHCICYVAVHNESQNVVGISLISTEYNPKFNKGNDKKDSVYMMSSAPFQSKIHEDYLKYIVAPLDEKVDFFMKFPNLQASLELVLLCVHSEHSGQGLATSLVHETVKYAERKDIKLISGIFTCPPSRKAAEKNGFQNFSDIDILSLRDNDGNLVYEAEESYIVNVMGKLL